MPQQKAFFLLMKNEVATCQKKAMFSTKESYVFD